MKNIIITGASSGVGKACARRCLKQGHRVILVARNIAAMKELTDEFANAYIINEDLSKPGAGEAVVNQINNMRLIIDGLIYCAGVAPLLKIEENTPDKVAEIFQINCLSFQEMIEAIIVSRKKIGGGGIVMVVQS